MESFHKVHGAWRAVGNDTMPVKDQQNVDLPGAPKHGAYRVIELGVAGLLLAVAAVVLLPVAGVAVALLGVLGLAGGTAKKADDPPTEHEDFSWQPPARERCTACEGGTRPCPTCGRARYLRDEQGVYSPCPTCNAQLFPCTCQDGYVTS